MKILFRIFDWIASAIMVVLALASASVVGYAVFYAIRGVARYMWSPEGQGLLAGLTLATAFALSAWWLAHRRGWNK